MTSAIAGGNALASMHKNPNRKKGDRSDEGKDKSKGKEKTKEKGSNGSPAQVPDPLNGVCRFHLKGKCRAGNSCTGP